MLIKHIKLLCTYYILIKPTFSTRNIGDVFCKETGQNKLKNCLFYSQSDQNGPTNHHIEKLNVIGLFVFRARPIPLTLGKNRAEPRPADALSRIDQAF